jgi:predicted enzyme related to lactoylglutathione lyase
MQERAHTPHWLPYIGTTDVEAAVGIATRLGARVLSPAEALPNGSSHAVLADPQGAVFGLYASDSGGGPDKPASPGEFSWHELSTSVSPSSAFAFYRELFGWDEITQHDMGPDGMYLIFGRNGHQLGGMFAKGGGKPGSAYWLGYVRVTDLEGTVESAKAARGSVLVAPMDVPGGDRVAQLMDPHGAFFAVHLLASDKGAAKPRAKPAPAAAAKPPEKKAAAKAPQKKVAKTAPKPAAKKPAAKAAPKKAAKKAKPAAAAAKKKASKARGKAKRR